MICVLILGLVITNVKLIIYPLERNTRTYFKLIQFCREPLSRTSIVLESFLQTKKANLVI